MVTYDNPIISAKFQDEHMSRLRNIGVNIISKLIYVQSKNIAASHLYSNNNVQKIQPKWFF